MNFDILQFVENLSGLVWGGEWSGQMVLPVGPMVILLLGVGLFLMIRLRFLPVRRLLAASKELWMGRIAKKGGKSAGDITPWNALSTALAGQVGTGNLAGVATALSLGGPGSIFWMWITALFGMALAFSESALAVKFREVHSNGHFYGGPMYYIKNGLQKHWHWIAYVFAIGTLASGIATGNMIQANSIATGIESVTGVSKWTVGLILSGLTFAVVIGGIKSIGSVAGKIVPTMALGYVVVAATALILNMEYVPEAFLKIFSYAFGLEQAAGGIAGYSVLSAVRFGVARGLFSNEAGQGSTPIAHAAAITDSPVRQGEIAMMGTFIDTIIICTMTALVILTVAGQYPSADQMVDFAWQSSSLEGAQVTTAVFVQAFPGSFGGLFVVVALTLFAFTTILGWAFYLEQAATFLCGSRIVIPMRLAWVGLVFLGAVQEVNFVWKLGDFANAMMALPNLLALLLLSPVVVSLANTRKK